MNWIKVPNSQFIRILEKCPDRDSNQGSIGHTNVISQLLGHNVLFEEHARTVKSV
jgi:hypothetical protein